MNVCITHDLNNNVYNAGKKSTVDSASNAGNEGNIKIIPHRITGGLINHATECKIIITEAKERRITKMSVELIILKLHQKHSC